MSTLSQRLTHCSLQWVLGRCLPELMELGAGARCWPYTCIYDRSSGAADSNILDEVKKVMNILYHRLQPQFVSSMSYDGLQISHIFMATIRVYAQNLFTFLVLVFKWNTMAASCLLWIVPVSQSSHNICMKDLM